MSAPKPVLPLDYQRPPMPTVAADATTPSDGAPAPLTPGQLRELADAQTRMKRIRRAIKVAKFDGWTLAICAGVTLLGTLMGASGWLVGIFLGLIAAAELWQAQRLAKLDPQAAKWLALNQVALALGLILYAAWNLIFPAPLPAEIAANNAQLKELGYDMGAIMTSMSQVLYGGLIIIALVVQGSMALFYVRRGPMVRGYAEQTPEWVRQVQAVGVEG